MTNEEILFIEIGSKFSDALKSQMFGKPCYKIKGKEFLMFAIKGYICTSMEHYFLK